MTRKMNLSIAEVCQELALQTGQDERHVKEVLQLQAALVRSALFEGFIVEGIAGLRLVAEKTPSGPRSKYLRVKVLPETHSSRPSFLDDATSEVIEEYERPDTSGDYPDPMGS